MLTVERMTPNVAIESGELETQSQSAVSGRFVPLIVNWKLRVTIGGALAAASPVVAARILDAAEPDIGVMLSFLILAWLPAAFLTDKYRHKYPQRYYPYLLASHFKAAFLMAVAVLAIRFVAGPQAAPSEVMFSAVLLFAVADAAVSIPRRRAEPERLRPLDPAHSAAASTERVPATDESVERVVIDSDRVLTALGTVGETSLIDFVRANLPVSRGSRAEVLILDDIPNDKEEPAHRTVAMLVAKTSLNNVNRLNLFLDYCTRRLAMGGYIVVSYTPLGTVNEQLKQRFSGALYYPAYAVHFLWYRALPKIPWLEKVYFSPKLAWLDNLLLRATKKRNRVLSKAEVWGRLAFYGMEVRAEKADSQTCTVIAQRITPPVSGKKPSFYAIVGLQKVALNGEIIRLHKVRSMYPFSEFLQKAIFESHGLSATGKFKDDFRITEYGKLFRRHWIDELPGVFDWLRGDIKLVGMRATSPHFLSLYPPGFYDLYVQVKPGLVPPIFDESTAGFDQIVETERTYLSRYMQAPLRTDLLYFWYTFRDIFLRKVRSK